MKTCEEPLQCKRCLRCGLKFPIRELEKRLCPLCILEIVRENRSLFLK